MAVHDVDDRAIQARCSAIRKTLLEKVPKNSLAAYAIQKMTDSELLCRDAEFRILRKK